MPNKAAAGRLDDIRACIACNQACIGHLHAGTAISCIQYPESGREQRYGRLDPAAQPRRVLVAGGGPAGMKLAIVAANRGHQVMLCEAAPRLGGQVRVAQLIPGRAEFGGNDLQGPVPIAVAGTPKLDLNGYDPVEEAGAADEADLESEALGLEIEEAGDDDASSPAPRLAVYGDSDFASNEMIEAYRNRDLFVNTVNWLLGDIEAISIRPVRSRASRFQLSTEQFMTIRTLSLFVIPESIAVLGVITWWRRRHTPAG